MSIRERIANFISPEKAKESVSGASMPSPGKMVDSDDFKYRRLTGGKPQERDLLPFAQERMGVIAAYLYEINALAKDQIDGKVEFGLGEGLSYIAEDDKVQEIMDSFWNDPVNQMPIRQMEFARDLGLFGELCLPVAVNKANGHVRLGLVDPKQIEKVDLDKNNALIQDKVHVREIKSDQGVMVGKPKVLKIIKQSTHPKSKSLGYLDGDCFYFSINKLSNSTRGRSDLLVNFDMLDAYDQFMWTLVEKAIMMNMLVWDVTLEGMDQKAIDEWMKKYAKPPKAGTVLPHNKKVKWEAIVPDFKSSDPSNHAKLFLSLIACGARKPRHFMGMPEDTNRALGTEMAEPTVKNMLVRQQYYKYMYTLQFNFAIDQAILHERLPVDVNKAFKIIFPIITTKGLDKTSRAMERAAKAFEVGINNGFITKETATEIMSTYTTQLGVDIDAKKEQGKIAKTPEEGNTNAAKEKTSITRIGNK